MNEILKGSIRNVIVSRIGNLFELGNRLIYKSLTGDACAIGNRDWLQPKAEGYMSKTEPLKQTKEGYMHTLTPSPLSSAHTKKNIVNFNVGHFSFILRQGWFDKVLCANHGFNWQDITHPLTFARGGFDS